MSALDWIIRGRTKWRDSHAETTFGASTITGWSFWHLGGLTVVEA